MPEPRISKLSGTVTWEDGTLFNGFALVGLVFPNAGEDPWPALTIEPNSPRQEIPTWTPVPITNGEFNSQVGVWFNADIDPPNTQYVIYYLDSSLKQVGVPSTEDDFFVVTSDPTVPPMYELELPESGTDVPSPGEN